MKVKTLEFLFLAMIANGFFFLFVGITDPLFQSIVEGMIAAVPVTRLGLDAVQLKLTPRLTH